MLILVLYQSFKFWCCDNLIAHRADLSIAFYVFQGTSPCVMICLDANDEYVEQVYVYGNLKKPNHKPQRHSNTVSAYAEALSARSPIQVINHLPSCHWCDILTSNTIMMKIHRRQLCRGRAIRHCVEERTTPSHQLIIALFVWKITSREKVHKGSKITRSAKLTSLVWIIITRQSRFYTKC